MKALIPSLFGLLLSFSNIAQNDTIPAVTRVLSGNGYAYAPVFSALCPGLCWFEEQAFDLKTLQFLPGGAASACPEAQLLRERMGNQTRFEYVDRTDRYLLAWQADPFDSRYMWSYEHVDPFRLLRYTRASGKLDTFKTLPQQPVGAEFVIGKPGIWVTNHRELVLIDRNTGVILARADNPHGRSQVMMSLRSWGDDVLVTNAWLYQRATKRYLPFFPLPQDMEGCQSPHNITFKQEICYSTTYGTGSNQGEFISAPGPFVRRLPFLHDWRDARNDLGANAPLAWFSFKSRIVALNYVTGDSVVYQGLVGTPLAGDQSGRYLAFANDFGLSFFDKNNCEFRIDNRPYGYEKPWNFISDTTHILLTYRDHWEVLHFSSLDTVFVASKLQQDYDAFEKQLTDLFTSAPNGFYPRYEAFAHVHETYEAHKNPKIEARWHNVLHNLGQELFTAPDSIVLRAMTDYEAGRFSPDFSCSAVEAFFRFWADQDELDKALHLLENTDNEACIQEASWSQYDLVQPVRSARFSLDSLAALHLSPEERLYATGKIWEQFGQQKSIYRYNQDPHRNLKKAYDCYRTLVQQYPQSSLADNAAYDTMTYIDFHSISSDLDFMIQGDDKKAVATFKRFLYDYPTSDRRPDVLQRIAAAFQRGWLQDDQHDDMDESAATEYLQIIAEQYPDFAAVSTFYKNSRQALDRHLWQKTWAISARFDSSVYHLQDSIRVTLRLHNLSPSVQALDTAFTQLWPANIRVHLNELRDTGCEGLWGDFPLIGSADMQPLMVAAGDYYEATFQLGHFSLNRNDGYGTFALQSGHTYQYSIDFRHPMMPNAWIIPQISGKFRVE